MSTPSSIDAPFHYYSDEPGEYLNHHHNTMVQDAAVKVNTDEIHACEILSLVLPRMKPYITKVVFLRNTIDEGSTGGVFLFDQSGDRILVHVTNAWIGNTESPPALSRCLLELLDVPANVIKHVNDAAWRRYNYYTVVLEIEK